MKYFYITFLLLLSNLNFAQDGSPASPYYDGFNFNQTGSNLKNALSDKLIAMHTVFLSYQDAEDCIKIIDRDPGDPINLLLIYGFSSNLCPDNSLDFPDHRRRNRFDDGTGFCQWNREHTYPRSVGTPDLGLDGPGADVHHLRASDVNRNANRGNTKFGPGSGNSGYYGSFWYPGDEWKGDIARMMMYMYLRYGNQCLPKNVCVGNTVASDSNMVDLLLQWNAEDPVSEIEDRRNTYLGNLSNFYAQGNRNPFIDNPYLATLIWGGTPAQNRWTGTLSTATINPFTSLSIYPNPARQEQVSIYSPEQLEDIQIYNAGGQLINANIPLDTNNNSYQLPTLSPGLYLIKLSAANQNTSRKLIVQ